MRQYLPLVLWFTYILADAVVSWYLIERKKIEMNQILFHILSTIVRGWFFILVGICVDITEQTLLSWFLFTSTSFWVLFDPLLNVFRERGLFYIGMNARIDRFGNDHPVAYWSLKIVAVLVGSISGYSLMR